MGEWWWDNVVEPGKLPMLLCLGAFVITFVITRVITRMIRAGKGPFKNNVSASGLHIHHAVPGIMLLILGALLAIHTDLQPWPEVAGVLIGIGMSLILDEFALILHLQDVYWEREGRISVELIGLTAACLALVMVGFSPLGVDDLNVGDLTLRFSLITALVIHGCLVLISLLKGKYRAGLVSIFLPLVPWVVAIRLARPQSWWARHFYGPKRSIRAERRAERFDRRWTPRWRWVSDLIAGSPTALPEPIVATEPTVPTVSTVPTVPTASTVPTVPTSPGQPTA